MRGETTISDVLSCQPTRPNCGGRSRWSALSSHLMVWRVDGPL